MRNRIIDYTRHPLYARQALGILLECWREDRGLPVLLLTHKGNGEITAKNIRVALAKEKKKSSNRRTDLNYGFTISEPFPYTVKAGFKAEAVLIRWRMTNLQNLKNIFTGQLSKELVQ